MKYNSFSGLRIIAFTALLAIASNGNKLAAQQSISFGIHANPTVGWFSSDNNTVKSKGARAGINFGLTLNKYFADNYAISTGISLISVGGSLAHNDSITLKLNKPTGVSAGGKVMYNIEYLVLPIGLKLKSNQIGYITLFADLGLDPKLTLGGKVKIPSLDISKEKANSELKNVSMGYHATGGIEYSLGGSSAVVVGINFESNFTDITKDTNGQPNDKILHKMFGLFLGFHF